MAMTNKLVRSVVSVFNQLERSHVDRQDAVTTESCVSGNKKHNVASESVAW